MMSDAPMEQTVRMKLRGVIYRDDEWWVSHCLELDIVGQGETPEEAFNQSVELCSAQIDAALADGDLESIIRPAPPEIWALYYRAHGKEREYSDGGALSQIEARELCAVG